ncbi:PREDICTED: uncharacterized protein LOC108564569 [Nicrophorus vespilloides]|uniref:Uncharacterized protein LOC108564569 n=1 Tax=Nicrophorus vespilloides TaxID=110193 RepID=A0ABM1MX41_NICVS|nr:PREDICTED: uncharacterized protein LOC108564569 [Nicrophorus vespilloides]
MFVKSLLKAFLLVVFIGTAVFAEEETPVVAETVTETPLSPEIDEKVESIVENVVETIIEEDAAAKANATEAGATGGGVNRKAIQAAIQRCLQTVDTLNPDTNQEVRADARGMHVGNSGKSNLEVIAEKLQKLLLNTRNKKKRKIIKKVLNQARNMIRNKTNQNQINITI